MKENQITQEYLKSIFRYNPETGIFTRLVKTSNAARMGEITRKLSIGYISFNVGGVVSYAHRWAFLYMLGYIPTYVDHIDCDRANNRWSNLREATKSQNNQNRSKSKGKTSSFKGVRKHSNSKGWNARIKYNQKEIHIGYFMAEYEAALAYDKKAVELFGEYAKLNFSPML